MAIGAWFRKKIQSPRFISVFYTNFQSGELEVALIENPKDLNSSFYSTFTSLKLYSKIT